MLSPYLASTSLLSRTEANVREDRLARAQENIRKLANSSGTQPSAVREFRPLPSKLDYIDNTAVSGAAKCIVGERRV